MRTVRARACSNIALVKYWGKRDAALNLPAAGSLSLTLGALTTTTSVTVDPRQPEDTLELDGAPADATRVSAFLDLVRARSLRRERARVVSANDFPTGSGLASSASGFAALAMAACKAYGLNLPRRELSILARRGSGSAARSIFGGFVAMHAGTREDGQDAHAEPVGEAWDLRMVVAVVDGGQQKDVSSRDGMTHTAATSPLYAGWLATVPGDLVAARRAIATRDLEALGAVAEASAMAMHASAIAARPSVIYWSGVTVEALRLVRELRSQGTGVWATVDAGPHVKALCASADAEWVSTNLAALPGVTRTLVSPPGGPAELLP
jgi:diphosphomevalonate decarboxylase